MITLDFKRKKNNFKRYLCDGYLVTAADADDGQKRMYQLFKSDRSDDSKYLPQINYNNYREGEESDFEVFDGICIDCHLTDVDELMEELAKYQDGMNRAKMVIEQVRTAIAFSVL